jgi:3-hydroxy acid dehydrogenase / malonic semialdehyde reductase
LLWLGIVQSHFAVDCFFLFLFGEMKSPIALITGATSGIGQSTATVFAEKGWNLILTGRRSDRLHHLKQSLESTYACQIHTACFDVREPLEVEQAMAALPPSFQSIDIVINNAGLALGKESLEHGDPQDWYTMIDTNIKGVLNISRCIIPGMKQRHQGTIINVGSIAGREAYPGGNVYSATKYAIDGLTKSMRIDLAPHGIRVGQVAPGAVETEFSVVRFHGDEEKAKAVYLGFQPLQPNDVAETIWFMASRPPHVTIQDVLIMPSAQSSASIILRNI